MSDEIKTNDTVEEVVETEVPETEEVNDNVDETEQELSQVDTAEQAVEDEQTVADEPAEEAEPKKKPKKDAIFKINPKTGKKRLRGWLITLITIVTILAVGTASVFIALEALAAGMAGVVVGGAPANHGAAIVEGDANYVSYADKIEQFKSEIEAGMKEDATDEEKVLAAWILYRIASMADYNAPEKAKYTTGGGRATGELKVAKSTMVVGGGLEMTSTYFTILDEQGNKYVAQEEYTQVPANSVEAIANGKPNNVFVSAGEAALPRFLGFARRGIVTPEKTVTWAGANESTVIDGENGVTGKFEDKEKSYTVLTAEDAAKKASVYERVYGDDWGDVYGGTAPDLSIHVINPQTIIADSVKIFEVAEDILDEEGNVKYAKGTDLKGNPVIYYAVEFKVDPTVVVAKGVDEEGNEFDIHTTWYAEQLYLANAGLDFLNSLGNYSLRYSELNVEMTVFKNGYIRTWSTDETWIMSADITSDEIPKMFKPAGAVLTSKNYSTEFYCYDHDTIMQGFVNRWFGDNVDMPMSDLPFASKLAGYKAQKYGTYR